MTHSLHREGTVDSLEKDYIIFAMPSSGLNHQGSLEKLKKVFKIFKKYHPLNIGDAKGGSIFSIGSAADVYAGIQENELVHAVFNSRETLVEVLKELKDEDLGLSVTISGLNDHVCECTRKAGLEPHTTAQSLGIWGKTDLLPNQKVLDIHTMCGHSLISFNIINELAMKVKEGNITAEQAGKELAKPCVCGIFNPERASALIQELVSLS